MRIHLVSRALILSSTACLLGVLPAAAQEWPSTRPERSEYRETSRYADVTLFLDGLEGRHPMFWLTSFGYSEEGRPLPLAVFGDVTDGSAAAVRSSSATRVLVFANIHAGEVAGKEAAQVLLREMARGLRDRWADSLVILVAPIYNADGNERIGLRNRPRQHGPVAGMGQRPNSRGLDLNRDNAKLESAEARALSRLVQEFDPHVALDLHTTNGTFHAYHLTYAPPLHPSTDAGITALLREEWLPAVSESVRDRYGWEFFYYGNVPGTFGMRGERGWYTFDHRPRFTTNYLGLRNRFGILSEAYSYATFEDRIMAHGRFVEAVIEYAYANATRVREVVEAADREPAPGMKWPCGPRWFRATRSKCSWARWTKSTIRTPGADVPSQRRADRREDARLRYVPRHRGNRGPGRLPGSGRSRRGDRASGGARRAGRPPGHRGRDRGLGVSHRFHAGIRGEFQGHRPREAWGAWRKAMRTIPRGAAVVPVRQPLGRLIVVLLEPRSDDGFLAWNLFDPAIEESEVYPITRLPELPTEACEECVRFR